MGITPALLVGAVKALNELMHVDALRCSSTRLYKKLVITVKTEDEILKQLRQAMTKSRVDLNQWF